MAGQTEEEAAPAAPTPAPVPGPEPPSAVEDELEAGAAPTAEKPRKQRQCEDSMQPRVRHGFVGLSTREEDASTWHARARAQCSQPALRQRWA
jgi:hypothetical protein